MQRTHPPRSDELLRTKLAPPRASFPLVLRNRLFERLDQGLAQKIILVAAPLGFGKSTLVGAWAAARDKPIAWVSLDAGDNDPIRFWRYVITACQTIDSKLGKTALAALRSSQQPSLDSILTGFVEELARRSSPLVLVLDDYHVITSREIHDTFTFWLDHLPLSLHLVLITRSEPPLPLARFRARGELAELSVDDLRFSLLEIRTLFDQVLKLPISTKALTRLEERTEGWAAALRLIGLALESRTGQADEDEIPITLAGEQHILDYLVGEAFANQPESVKTFLLQTGSLDRLCGPLCDAVTGKSDSTRVLSELAHANLFLIPLGDEDGQTWFRYHTLFAETLQYLARQQIGETELRVLADRAALWLHAHSLLDQAIEASISAHSFERAAEWIERLIEQRGSNEIYTFRRWIEQLPQDVLDHHPDLLFVLAMALFFTQDRFLPATAARGEAPLRTAERIWRAEKNAAKLGQVFSLRSIITFWQGDLHRAFAYARESLELLPDDDTNWRGNAVLCVGMEELLAGNIHSAQNRFIEARALCGAAQNIHGVLAALTLSADAYVWQGEFEQATAIYVQVLRDAVGGEAMRDDQAEAHLGLASIAYERNDLTGAEQHATQTLELSQPRSNEQMQVNSSVLLARVDHAHGKTAQAQERLHALVARIRQPRLLRQIHACQARLALDAHDLDAVHRWYDSLALDDSLPRAQQEQEQLLAVRMYIGDGRPDPALELAETWLADARAAGRARSEIEALGICALAQVAQSNRDRANKTLARAFALARSKGYRRIVLDEGEPMRLQIAEWKLQIEKSPGERNKNRQLLDFASQLLGLFDNRHVAPIAESEIRNSQSANLLEPLSPQEQRVLHLLAAGLSNPEIARELVVSTNTIKTQLQSIYRKLDVTNREQAAERARQLNLL